MEKYTTTDEQEEKNLAKIDNKERRPMLTDALRKNLSKEGYKLIGSHSGQLLFILIFIYVSIYIVYYDTCVGVSPK